MSCMYDATHALTYYAMLPRQSKLSYQTVINLGKRQKLSNQNGKQKLYGRKSKKTRTRTFRPQKKPNLARYNRRRKNETPGGRERRGEGDLVDVKRFEGPHGPGKLEDVEGHHYTSEDEEEVKPNRIITKSGRKKREERR